MIKKDFLNGAIILLAVLLSLYPVAAQEGANVLGDTGVAAGLRSFGLALGAGMAAGAACAGAGIGAGIAGSAALGAIAEKREMLAMSLVFVALAEGVALYGLAVSFVLIGKL